MMIIRPITQKDQTTFTDFGFETIVGMTNLPRERSKFLEKIIHSEKSFMAKITEPGKEEYYFVLEDAATGRIGGICGILTQSTQSFDYMYRIEVSASNTQQMPGPKEIKILTVVPNPPDSSEVCALYLHPSFRHGGHGRLLSFSRFLFIAAFKERFRKNMIAEMRGTIDSHGMSLFWEGIGRHFCHLSFVDLMAQFEKSHDFIKGILPQYPIYISLLSQEVQEVIGKTHESTKPAYQMLTQENFTFNQEVDLLEGGPILRAETGNIRSIKNSAVAHVEVTADPLEEQTDYMLGNERINFRACMGKMQLVGKSKALIGKEVANALLINSGDAIRYVTLH